MQKDDNTGPKEDTIAKDTANVLVRLLLGVAAGIAVVPIAFVVFLFIVHTIVSMLGMTV